MIYDKQNNRNFCKKAIIDTKVNIACEIIKLSPNPCALQQLLEENDGSIDMTVGTDCTCYAVRFHGFKKFASESLEDLLKTIDSIREHKEGDFSVLGTAHPYTILKRIRIIL